MTNSDTDAPNEQYARPIIQSIQSTSSGTGTSFYLQASKCARRANLDKKHADIRRDIQKTEAADVGTLVHGLLAHYYQRQASDALIRLDDMQHHPSAVEATRIFSAYTRHFAPDELGEVVAVERLYPKDDTESALMKAALGLSNLGDMQYTMRPDLIVRLTAAGIDRLARTRPLLSLPGPGVYIVDHKTQATRNSNDALKYRFSPQFLIYQMCYNAVNPDEPCRGMIANVMVKHAQMALEKSFYSIFCPTPTSIDIEAIQKFLLRAYDTAKTDAPNLAACFDFSPCPYLTSGLCDRT